MSKGGDNDSGRVRSGVTTWLLGWLVVSVPVTAMARPCQEAIFDCGRNGDVNVKNTKVLLAEGRSVSWIRSHCRPSVVEPPGCDWTGRTPSAAATTTVLARNPATTYTDALPEPAPPVHRDNARRGPTPAPRDTVSPETVDSGVFADEIAAAAQRYKLPPQLIRAVMMVESGGNPLVLSGKGAVGLMQLLPATAREMGVDDIHDVAQNLLGGARFLRVLANRFDGDLVKVLSAYHAGSTKVLGRDATPFAATDDYVRKVLRLYYQFRDAGR